MFGLLLKKKNIRQLFRRRKIKGIQRPSEGRKKAKEKKKAITEAARENKLTNK